MYSKVASPYVDFVKANRKPINTGHTIVPCILTNISTKTSKANNKEYFFIVATTLNRRDIEIHCTTKKKPGEGEEDEEEPPSKRTKQDPSLPDSIIKPYSEICFNSFERTTLNTLQCPCFVKVSLVADLYNGNISFKSGQIIPEGKFNIDTNFYNKFLRGGKISEIPTKHNIRAEDFPETMDPKYYKRTFALPLTLADSKDMFTNIEFVLDVEDPKRFSGRSKDDDEIYPSVNMDAGMDKTMNFLPVVYTMKEGKRIFFKYGYRPTIWSCFGVTNLDKWAKSAGRMFAGARGWFVFGSSSLENINRMAVNASSSSDGYDFEDEQMQSNDVSVPDESTAGFVSHMSIDLAETAKYSGIQVSREWVLDKFSPKNYKYPSKKESDLNANSIERLKRNEKCVLNITELPDFIRADEEYQEMVNLLGDKIKFYAIFPVGDNRPYEHVGDIHEFLKANPTITPSTIFAVVQ